MELIVKHFSELSAEELFEIYKLRVSVFIVEQSALIRISTMLISRRTMSGCGMRTASKPMPVCSRLVSLFPRRLSGASSR